MTRIGPVCVASNEAAFQFRIDIDLGESSIEMTSTDAMVFDDAGKIVSMRAYADGEAHPDTRPSAKPGA
jgi:steroid delta-isomerase